MALRNRDGWALSGGEQQMVALGRALVAGPRLLLLDEPSLGLAPIVTKTLFAALKEIAERTPILLVEQNTAMAFRLCTRACVMVGGQIVLSGTADELRDRSALVASYLGEEVTTASGTDIAPPRRTGVNKRGIAPPADAGCVFRSPGSGGRRRRWCGA